MQDIHSMIRALKRPKLLVQAARFGVDDYNRDQHLRRIFKTDLLPRPAAAAVKLLDLESEMNDQRRIRSANYSPARHLQVMIALLAEAKTMNVLTRVV